MNCSRENEILRANKNSCLTPELQRHLSECAACSGALQISRALESSSAPVNVERGDARIIWLLAAERRHAETEQKLARVIRFGPLCVALLVAMVGLAWALLTDSFVTDGFLSGTARVGLALLVAAIFACLVVWTAPVRGRSS